MALLLEQRRSAEQLRLVNLRFDSALNNMPHGVMMCDSDGLVAVVNRRFCDILGLDPTRVVPGVDVRTVLRLSIEAGNYPGRSFADVYADHAAVTETGRREAAERTIRDGRTVTVTYEPMADGGWTATYEDISERRQAEAQIVFLARHDPLTRLPNRMFFLERLQEALARADRGASFALLYMDLDQFKAVNDTLGHPTGDALLNAVALRLQAAMRGSDTVARLGGDEFAILQLGAATRTEVTSLAKRTVERISEPYDIDGHQLVIGASIGIAIAPKDGDHAAQLLKNADLALYRAKQEGRGRWSFFEPGMDALAQARRVLQLNLRSAALLQQLELHYQPVVCTRTRQALGFEALLRWHHPTRGMVPPSEFITAAEEIGIIVPVGAWALRQACEQAANWPEHLTVAVNISAIQFRSRTLVETVSDALRLSGISPQRLELEITESLMLEDNSTTLATMHELRALGVRFSMDDFGTGYSSLSYLRSFPFDSIKIDRSFVTDLRARDDCLAIVRAVTGLAGSLRMKTIAEGVETEEQFRLLAGEGCTAVQGYLFSSPLPAASLPELIARLSGSDAARRLPLFVASE